MLHAGRISFVSETSQAFHVRESSTFNAGFHITVLLAFIHTYIYFVCQYARPTTTRYKVLQNILSNICGHTRSTARRAEDPLVCSIVIPDKPSLSRVRFPDSARTRKGGPRIFKTQGHDDIYLYRSAGRVIGRYNRCEFNGFG